jgi:membrane peptidoglycan carboxypeptidase
MRRGRRLLCIGGLTIGLAALATYPISAGVATLADGITLTPAAQATIVFDVHDRPVFTFFREDRTDVALDRVSPQMIAAVLAIEDRRFYEHHGVDFVRVLGAAWADLRARRFVEGGSSITQQLVRLDTLSRQRTISRKVREMLLATAIERRFAKPAILEAYLNRVYFGDGYYGIESAARGYFGKTAENLTAVEAATLAGLIKSPSAYAPREAPDRALARRNRVLRAMRDTGALTAEDARVLASLPLRVQQRDHDEYPRAAVDTAVDRALSRAAAGPAPLFQNEFPEPSGRNGLFGTPFGSTLRTVICARVFSSYPMIHPV